MADNNLLSLTESGRNKYLAIADDAIKLSQLCLNAADSHSVGEDELERIKMLVGNISRTSNSI